MHRLRWIPFILIAGLLLVVLLFEFFPRFFEGMQGEPETWAASGEWNPEITWDPSDPRKTEESPEDPAESSEDAVAENAEAVPEAILETREMTAENSRPSTPPRESPGQRGQGNRSARLLYQEWPRIDDFGEGGVFRYRVFVDRRGEVTRWETLDTFDCPPCEKEAERIVRGLRFRPALRDGKKVPSQVSYEIRFGEGGGPEE
ncbi:MAG: energy transducer TonB [Candidatus Krumholzibacteria bacterium]|nr:energy transducer TonB [Candidatus Krumholzibacteria bacterium]MDP6668641.1 energy transducer TonB [Candidatus Krumholzibacteria bacterium]MDP6797340.1 energy transducer TonB [Candidatus Krumholzibacteria bacterium]MDP7021012.1 energy transducer TonB [Candidatus Krumholzibacteria bacterium]